MIEIFEIEENIEKIIFNFNNSQFCFHFRFVVVVGRWLQVPNSDGEEL